ncbi:DMT family transporter [Pradoshia sp.]
MIRFKGISFIIIGSVLWGLTGPIMEWVLGVTEITVPFLVTFRLILSGIILLAFLFMMKKDIFAVWKSPSARIQLLLFGILGILGLQYTFLGAIDASNAIVATLFQFSAPIIIVIYVSLKDKRWPRLNQVLGIVGTLIGLFLLLTNGSIDSLTVSSGAILFGIALGLAYSFYTLYPTVLMKDWGIFIILGWGMLVGGIFIGIVTKAWNSTEWIYLTQKDVAMSIILLLIFGTMGYAFFLGSLHYISAVEVSILSSVEPLTVMLLSVLWFETRLGNMQLIGVGLMLIFVIWLSLNGRKE